MSRAARRFSRLPARASRSCRHWWGPPGWPRTRPSSASSLDRTSSRRAVEGPPPVSPGGGPAGWAAAPPEFGGELGRALVGAGGEPLHVGARGLEVAGPGLRRPRRICLGQVHLLRGPVETRTDKTARSSALM